MKGRREGWSRCLLRGRRGFAGAVVSSFHHLPMNLFDFTKRFSPQWSTVRSRDDENEDQRTQTTPNDQHHDSNNLYQTIDQKRYAF